MGRKRGLSDEQIQRVQFLYYESSNKISQIAAILRVSPGPIHNIIDRKGAYSDILPYQKTKERTVRKMANTGKLLDATEILQNLDEIKLDSALRYLKALRGPEK